MTSVIHSERTFLNNYYEEPKASSHVHEADHPPETPRLAAARERVLQVCVFLIL